MTKELEFRPARKAERLSNCLNHLPGEIEMAGKARPRHAWTKRRRELYCSLTFVSLFYLFRIGGSFGTSEIPLFEVSEHYPYPHKNPGGEQCLVGSLTGAIDSYRATESYKGTLVLNGNQDDSANAKECLTARPTSRAGTKVGVSDPAMFSGKRAA